MGEEKDEFVSFALVRGGSDRSDDEEELFEVEERKAGSRGKEERE